MSKFASKTRVPVAESQAELTELLRRYDSDEVLSGFNREQAFLGFKLAGRTIKLVVPLPTLDSFAKTTKGKKRSREDQAAAHDQAHRSRWRCLLLVVKAKLEAVEIGMSTIEHEFLADLTLANGMRVGDVLKPSLDRIIAGGDMPPLLPAAGSSG